MKSEFKKIISVVLIVTGSLVFPALVFSYNVLATREGLVGGITANQHVIVDDDWFVALPSGERLAGNNRWNHRVRVTYGNRSIIAPVWDVGPWNELDNYWVENRNTWGVDEYSLTHGFPAIGVPMAQQSYRNGWHYGYTVSRTGIVNGQYVRIPYDPITGNPGTQRRVTNEAGIDLADGVFLNGLRLQNNAWVNWDFTSDLPMVKKVRLIQQREGKTIVIYDSKTKESNSAGIGTVTFKIEFTETMRTNNNMPEISFGLSSPYTQHKATASTGWTRTTYEYDTWIGIFNIPENKSEDYDGTNTISIVARDWGPNGGNQIDQDENTSSYNPGTDTNHKIYIDTTPPKIKKVGIFPQEKVEGTMTTMGACGYSKDYDTGNIVSRPLVRECLHLVKIT
ncbi:MAG: hypothetical protein AB1630_12150, partial [bacterium]